MMSLGKESERAVAAGPQGLLADAGRLCPGLIAALLVDIDGVLVDRWVRNDSQIDPDELAVEMLAAVPGLGRTSAASKLGGIQEWLTVGEKGLLIVRRVPRLDLLLVLRTPSTLWTGKLRFAARVVAGRLSNELAGS